jgi:hypothetical protein
VEEDMGEKLFLASQVLISFVDPIGARGIEDIKIDRVFESFSLVRHVRRNAEHLTRVDNDLLAVNPELQRSIQNVGELFVMVAVLGNNAALFQQHTREHNFLANHELPL